MEMIQSDSLVQWLIASYGQVFRDPYGLPCDRLSFFHKQYIGTNALYKLMEPFIKNEIVCIRT